MDAAEEQIRALVDAETAAWNARDASALAALFHPDTVWPWPPNSTAHDPMQSVMPLGRYNRERWIRSWQELFDSHDLVHNWRRTLRVVMSEQGDGGFAVVDVDTQSVRALVGSGQHGSWVTWRRPGPGGGCNPTER